MSQSLVSISVAARLLKKYVMTIDELIYIISNLDFYNNYNYHLRQAQYIVYEGYIFIIWSGLLIDIIQTCRLPPTANTVTTANPVGYGVNILIIIE